MHKHTLKEMSSSLAEGLYTSVELTQYLLDRAKKANTELNAFISFTEETALEQAKFADKLRSQHQATALTGIPIAHKDLFCTKGIKTTSASKMLSNFIPPYDATVVSNLQAAGTVCIGKTNMDEFAMGSSNETSFFGKVANPWDQDRVPGGSSGGSAAAVAARLVPAATATDTGGSIRQPAALTATTGLKPTYGRVSRWGMIAFASSLDQAGPITQTAEDSALMLNAMAGFDEKDSTSVNRPNEDFTEKLSKALTGKTLGLPKEYFPDNLDTNVAQCIQDAVKVFETLGCKIKEIQLPTSVHSIPAYYIIAPSECSANLARMDGIRFGHRCDNPESIEELYTRSRAEGFGDEVKRRIMTGTYALSAGFYDAYYVKAQKVRRMIKQDFQTAFEHVDLILSPTAPSTAFKTGEKGSDPLAMYLEDVFTIATNLAGLPAISVPSGFVQGLPVGLQIIGDYFQESQILNAAHQYQLHTDWHTHTPKHFDL